MHMRIGFIQMHDKGCYILFTKPFTYKFIHVLSPFFYLRMPDNIRVISPFFEVHHLVTKGQTMHLISGTP